MNKKLRENVRACHEALEADLRAGDPKAQSFVASMHGELNAARKSLGLPLLPITSLPNVQTQPDGSSDHSLIMNLREEFEKNPGTDAKSCLRKLAAEIAAYPCVAAQADSFFSARPPPFNFLANGKTRNYQPLKKIGCPTAIAQWKFSNRALNCCLAQGFADLEPEADAADPGLSLLFDPLVDAFLAAHLKEGPLKLGGTVIVLSDFGAIYDPSIRVVGFSGNDWGEDETNTVLKLPFALGTFTGRGLDKSTRVLTNCLGATAQKKGSPANSFSEIVTSRNVFVWNFMPFFRGGADSGDDVALPDPKCSNVKWQQECLLWLDQFLTCVEASKVVLCVNKSRLLPLTNGGRISINDPSWQAHLPAIWPPPPLINGLMRSRGVFSLNHPCSRHWHTENNCADIASILGGV